MKKILRKLKGRRGVPITDRKVTEEASEIVDVNDLLSKYTVEELAQSAEEYFASMKNFTHQLKKPFGDINEAQELLLNFSQLLMGMHLLKGMKVLDFGAGTCWTSGYFTQLGMDVTAIDVSQTALKIGENHSGEYPAIGEDMIPPKFLTYDGYSIPLEDESIDRIVCFDCFHHVPNQEDIIAEFSRVLKKNGLAGFVEPGPEHSKANTSQFEMQNYRVIENDIHVSKIWELAKLYGFTDMKIAVFNTRPFHLSLTDFESFMEGSISEHGFVSETRLNLTNRRIFWISKGNPKIHDSRNTEGLFADIHVDLHDTTTKRNEVLEGSIRLKNSGKAIWRPSSDKFGPVNLGIHLLDGNRELIDLDYFRSAIPSDSPEGIVSGEEVKFVIRIPAPDKAGVYYLEFDLVSEQVAWFAVNGVQTMTMKIEVN